MKIAVTGASGLVGYPIVQHLKACGHEVTTLGRTPLPGISHISWSLSEPVPRLDRFEGLVHAAFTHQPGKYRGGEGNDPEGFLKTNLEGTRALWAAAREATVHAIFLSSRAVYGDYPAGTDLTEELPPRPDSLYGEMKLAAERDLGHSGTVLRVTGVCGPPPPGRDHKWTSLFRDFVEGKQIAPRIGTEVFAADVAQAVRLTLETRRGSALYNVSGFILDRRDLLETFRQATGQGGYLPAASNPSSVSAMSTVRLQHLGWTPRGPGHLPTLIKTMAN